MFFSSLAHAELYLWVRAREPVSPLGLVDIPGDQSRPNGKGKGKEEKKGDKNAASAGTAVPPAPTLCCISMEWQVGMCLAELTVTLSTTVRVHHCGACVCGCECAYTPIHSVRCRSTAEWLRRGRLGPSVSGLVPALSFPTHPRRNGGAVPRASVKIVNLETIIDMQSWCRTWPPNGSSRIRAKQKLQRKHREACKSSWSLKSFTLTIP